MKDLEDLQEKIFFECKNIIETLANVSSVEDILAKRGLADELLERISFLRVLEKNEDYFKNFKLNDFQNLVPETNSGYDEGFQDNDIEEEVLFTNTLNDFSTDNNQYENSLNIDNQFNTNDASPHEDCYEKENTIIYSAEIDGSVQTTEEVVTQPILDTENKDISENLNPEIETANSDKNQFTENFDSNNEETNTISIEADRLVEDDNSDEIVELTSEDQDSNNPDTKASFEEEIISEPKNVEDFFIINDFEAIIQNDEPEPVVNNEENTNVAALESSKIEEVEENLPSNILSETENTRGKILDIEHPNEKHDDSEIHKSDLSFEEQEKETEHQKKFRLSHIKSLKSIESLFDADVLEQLETEKRVVHEAKDIDSEKGNLAKINMPTQFMEAEKAKPEFRLDLNDRIAFSKNLFQGSQVELNDTIKTLNSFKTLEEAKEFLSDIYYEKNWEKVDDYAQRLWTLVENKFL